MPIVNGVNEVIAEFGRRSEEYASLSDTCVVVGYTAAYALWVHEAVEMTLRGLPRPRNRGKYWDPQGRAQAKFLETPARQEASTMALIVRNAMRAKMSPLQALGLAGLHLQAESMKLVPVDTTNLKGSAFTREEKYK